MDGLTLTEMAQILGVPPKTVERRIQRAGFKPITREAIYAPEVLEAIRNVRMGRPPKAKK
jgi:IS30 family transposase